MNERAARKKQLIAEAALQRAELLLARQAMHEGVRPDAIARDAFRHLLNGAASVFGRRQGWNLSRIDLPTILPLLMSGLSMVGAGKSWLKILLRAGAIAGIAGFIGKKGKRAAAEKWAGQD